VGVGVGGGWDIVVWDCSEFDWEWMMTFWLGWETL